MKSTFQPAWIHGVLSWISLAGQLILLFLGLLSLPANWHYGQRLLASWDYLLLVHVGINLLFLITSWMYLFSKIIQGKDLYTMWLIQLATVVVFYVLLKTL